MGIALDYESGLKVIGHFVRSNRVHQKGHKLHHNLGILIEAKPDHAIIKPCAHGGKHERVPWSSLSYCNAANSKNKPRQKPAIRGGFAK